MSKFPLRTWMSRALRASAFLWTLTAGAVIALATVRAELINGLRNAGAMAAGRWYAMADLLIPYYTVFGGAFLALALLTGILWIVQRQSKQESAPAAGVST